MSNTNEPGSLRQDVADALRRIGQHRTMLAEILEVHLRALGEMKDLLARSPEAAPAEMPAAAVDSEIRRATQAARLLAGAPAGARPPVPKVLLVDDDPTTRNIISHFLRKEEFIVEKASDGNDGLAKARAGKPDLLIVDAVVPGRDGFEVLSLLRKDLETAAIPILMLSTLGEEEAIVKGLEEGADYIIKPFSPQVLVATVRKILRERCGRAFDHRSL
jgi:PleD family two-component response regulator